MYLVTGGAGFFGETLVLRLLKAGHKVTCFDLNLPQYEHPNLTIVQGDIRDRISIIKALENVEVIHHNVAQVPIAKDRKLFWSVNYEGMKILLDEVFKKKVKRFVYTSSSAVFGIPDTNPVSSSSKPKPQEDYGKAKLAGESLCHEYSQKGLSCSIIRPRTVLGTGRLGIFQILFEWIYQGRNIPVIGSGKNIYQFVHSDDLATACILAGDAKIDGIFNIGTNRFGTMRAALENLVRHAGSQSQVKSVPAKLTEIGMNVTSALGISPLGAYHSLMYGNSMFFNTDEAHKSLGFEAKYSNDEMLAASYDWYCDNRFDILNGKIVGSKHQSAMKQRILQIVPYFLV